MSTVTLFGIDALTDWLSGATYTYIYVLVDSNTREHCLPALLGGCTSLANAEIIEVDPGEESKDIDIVAGIWEALLQTSADRHSLLINLGGGMITDLGGFVAATFKRGIDFIHIPTSLLAMVDASIGGKTGINLGHAKNQVGTFSMPKAIVLSEEWLETLPDREYRSGLAEMIKHALVADADHLLEIDIAIGSDNCVDSRLIRRSAEIKQNIVALDPFEQGARKTLNFGHTAGHALESLALSTSQPLLHGEAITEGMLLAVKLSVDCGLLPQTNAEQIESLIQRCLLPNGRMSDFSPEQLWSLIQHDKKNRGERINFVLLKEIGKAVIDHPVTFDQFKKALGRD